MTNEREKLNTIKLAVVELVAVRFVKGATVHEIITAYTNRCLPHSDEVDYDVMYCALVELIDSLLIYKHGPLYSWTGKEY